MLSHPVQGLHRKAALTTICQQFNFRDVDDRKGWFNKTNQSEVDWVISLVGVWNCESSGYIRGRDGACLHAVGFLARSERLEHNQCHGLFLSFTRSSSLASLSLFCGDGGYPLHIQ